MTQNVAPPATSAKPSTSPTSGSPSESSDVIPDVGNVSPPVSPILSDHNESPKKLEQGDGEKPSVPPVQVDLYTYLILYSLDM